MDINIILYLLLAISACTLALCAYLFAKMKTVLYLLEQPIVKKMSPQLKLKPVKIDELIAEKNRQQQQNRPPQNGQRPQHQHGSRPNNDRFEHDRRPDQGRDRQENRDRQDRRPERSEGDRNRNQNQDRFRDRDRNRMDRSNNGGDRNRPPREPQPEMRDAAAPDASRSLSQSPIPASNESMPPLSPRRPLPSTVESETRHESPPVTVPESDNGAEAGFNSESDVQHGRRTQMKKKPHFDLDETEIKATTEG